MADLQLACAALHWSVAANLSMAAKPRLMLASQSPRRFDLLRQMGMTFEVEPADIDETPRDGEDAESYVLRLAQAKARAQWRSGYVNLGADTIVVLDGALLGKPQNEQHCVDMLLELSDRTHQVATGIALFDGENTWNEVVVSSVTFRAISESEARAYWDSGEPQDKAGAYALQGLGGVFVLRIAGSHSGIIGLPMTETEQLLRAAGIQTWSELGRG